MKGARITVLWTVFSPERAGPLFGMALRQTPGFVESLLRLIGLDWAVPDFSTLSRRQTSLKVNIPYRGSHGPLHLWIDSTGIKVEGEGEWNARKHGGAKRRVWRKIHLGIDEETLEIRAAEFTTSDVGDAPMLPELLDQIPPEQEILGKAREESVGLGLQRSHEHEARALAGDLGQRIQDSSRLVKWDDRGIFRHRRIAPSGGSGRLDTRHDTPPCQAPSPSFRHSSATSPLASFARGLMADEAAVVAALREPWSNGQTEGQINRLKMLKRQMYGRAGLALLTGR